MTADAMKDPEKTSYHDAYREGYKAFYDGYELEENPYPQKSVPFGGWEDGWLEAHTDKGGDYDSR